MKIEKIEIEGYKSIKSVVIEPSDLINTFIGGNSTGKSNVFSAITWLLGPSYPSFNGIKKEDHFLGNDANKIRIKLYFDDGHSLEMNEAKEGRDGLKSGLFYDDQTWNCNGEIRSQYSAAYLGVDRKILEYLPSNKWSLVGRILQEVNKKFLQEDYTYKGQTKSKQEWLKEWLSFVRDNLLFSVKNERGEDVMKKFLEIVQKESAQQLNKEERDFKIDLSLYDPWNFYKTLQLLVHEQDMDLDFQAAELGMGVQASISIAILKAYSEINLGNSSPIFIDEPELFLHPQAQRNFYKILRELSQDKFDSDGTLIREGTQIFFTTHSPNFLSAGNFDEIFLVRKYRDLGTYIKNAKVSDFIEDLSVRKSITSGYDEMLLSFKNAYENTGDTQKANEAFFSKKIILVEGATESLILPYLFEKVGFDYIRMGISIVACGGKNELDRFYRLYTELGIPCYIIFDGDKQLIGTPEEISNKKKNNAIFELLGSSERDYPNGSVNVNYLGFEKKTEDYIGFATSKKGLDLLIATKEKIEAGQSTVPAWIEELKERLVALPEEVTVSVLKKIVPGITP